jgi:lysophospholipase L1-like esterase
MTRIIALVVGAALAVVAASAGAGETQDNPPDGTPGSLAGCATPAALLAIEPTLARVAARIEKREKLVVVAVGSSSTEGIGASTPALSYPSRLEAELRQRFPRIDVRVINRGKRGEDAPEELARLDSDVIAERPDLVIWQVGTNAVLRRDDLATDRDLIRRGIDRLQRSASDVVLMDLQYAPRVIARPAYAEMQQLLVEVAHDTHVGMFRRFEIMRHWQAEEPPDAAPAIGPDGLHMTDRSYGCLAAGLAEAIAGNWRQYERAARRALAARIARLSPADLVGSDDP